MMEVFISTLAIKETQLNRIRRQMYLTCLQRWEEEPNASLCPLWPDNVSDEEFQRTRRIRADELACSDFYILADDDCLLETSYPYIDHAMDIMNRHPDFAILSWWPINANIVPWTPPKEEHKYLVNGTHYDDEEVTEHASSGGIRLCRKGCMKDWPPMLPNRREYDQIHCARLRKLGWRSGYFKNLRMLHIGRHYSLIQNVPIDEVREHSDEVNSVLGFLPIDGSEGVVPPELVESIRKECGLK